MRKLYIPILIILILIAAGGGYWFYQKKSAPQSASVYSQTNSETQSGDTADNTDPKNLLKNYGPMPELVGLEKTWFNSDPLTKEKLKGKTVLVNFWTYSSINSIRTLPQVTKWYDTYKDQGLVVIGIHTPEFNFEKVPLNVESAIKKYAIGYPVALDNNYKTWTAFKNQFWPAQYLINPDGNIVYTHFGEGKYDVTEKAIRTLLGLEGDFQIAQPDAGQSANTAQIYFGLTRLQNFGGAEKPNNGEQIFTFPAKLKANQFALEGTWVFNQEAAVHTKGFGRIKLNFNAAKVFMVAQSDKPTTIKVYVDGQLVKGVVVSGSDLYQLYDSATGGQHTMEIEVPDNNFQAFTFTFG
ncbi:MAG TPA: redoxin domain-containing protein [Patescibacteria group bacterium]|jgi:thiol-disulfide isomerase/thioredoxin|nr:redoxin domain-containing protein [Patescibacteria group bacterium]